MPSPHVQETSVRSAAVLFAKLESCSDDVTVALLRKESVHAGVLKKEKEISNETVCPAPRDEVVQLTVPFGSLVLRSRTQSGEALMRTKFALGTGSLTLMFVAGELPKFVTVRV